MADVVEVITESSTLIELLGLAGDTFEILEDSVSVVEVIVEGPAGPSGQAGAYHEVEYTAPADGPQTIPITYPPTGFRLLTINGLQQPSSGFTITGTTLNVLAALSVVAGDLIHFTFSKG